MMNKILAISWAIGAIINSIFGIINEDFYQVYCGSLCALLCMTNLEIDLLERKK